MERFNPSDQKSALIKPAAAITLRRVSGPATACITAATRVCAVYGHPIRHSASPAMQNAGLAALGLNWRYLAFDVEPASLQEAIRGAAAMRFVGLNLTVPHKLLALDIVDVLDASAREWGAVNTIQFEGRAGTGDWQPVAQLDPGIITEVRSRGFNTDADAILRSIREDLKMEVKFLSVLQLGAGGAGRTAALRLAAEGVRELHLVNRTADKAEVLVNEIRARFPGVKAQAGYPAGEVDLVLNATSLGLKPDDALPLDESRFPLKRARAVYDMVYRPAETRLLAHARASGCQTANGIGMLLYQGAKALEIWTGHPAPVGEMREALLENVYAP